MFTERRSMQRGGRARPPGAPGFIFAASNRPAIRPHFRFLDEICPDRILQNVGRFGLSAFVSAQSMIKKVLLPRHSNALCCPAFPFTNQQVQRLVGGGSDQNVHVIRHDNRGKEMPLVLFMAINHGLHQSGSNLRGSQGINSAPTGAHRDKKYGSVPQGKRNGVGQPLSPEVHAGVLRDPPATCGFNPLARRVRLPRPTTPIQVIVHKAGVSRDQTAVESARRIPAQCRMCA